MLLRIRKGWKELRKEIYNRGWDTFEVYVCTCSESAYASEVWRLLDPGNRLIPAHLLKDRLLCVPWVVDKGIPTQGTTPTTHLR